MQPYETSPVDETWASFYDIPPDPPTPPMPPQSPDPPKNDRGPGGADERVNPRNPKRPPQSGGAQVKVERESELVCV